MIIDFHTHIFSPDVRGRREEYARRDDLFAALYGDPRAKLALVEDLIGSMDADGVDKAVACGFPWDDLAICRHENDYILDAARRYPDRIIGFMTVQPKDGVQSAAEVRRGQEAGLRGIGELNSEGQAFCPDDFSQIGPFLDNIKDLGLPLMIHTNEPIGHSYPGKVACNILEIHRLAMAYPEITIICPHWGGGLLFYELMPEVPQAHRNLYYDTSASPYLYSPNIYAVATQIIGSERILWGTDYPLLSHRRCLSEVQMTGLSPQAMRNILGDNAARLLGLDRQNGVSVGSGQDLHRD